MGCSAKGTKGRVLKGRGIEEILEAGRKCVQLFSA